MLLFFKHFMELNLIVFGMVDLCCNVGLIGELNVVMGGHDQIEEWCSVIFLEQVGGMRVRKHVNTFKASLTVYIESVCVVALCD
jgi:hypothetical protein